MQLTFSLITNGDLNLEYIEIKYLSTEISKFRNRQLAGYKRPLMSIPVEDRQMTL